MASRNELAVRARAVGLDPATYANDSKLEQKVLWLEKNATTFAGTAGSGTLTSDNTNNADTETVTIGSRVYTFKTALTGAKAVGTLTSDATAPSDGDTVSIEGQTYVFRTTLSSPVRLYEVLIGVSAAAALDNIKLAINAGTNAGEYAAGTPAHPLVTATTNSNTTQVVEAKAKGVLGNKFLTAENSTHLSWGGASLASGADVVAGEVLIGADADGSLTNLKNAVAGGGTAGTDYAENTPVHAQGAFGAVAAHAMVFTLTDFAVTNADVATTETGAHLSWGAGTIASGVRKQVAANGTTVLGSAGLSGDKNV